MRVLVEILGPVALVALLYFFVALNRHVNKVAWKRNDEGRGNFMTRPIWGKYARR